MPEMAYSPIQKIFPSISIPSRLSPIDLFCIGFMKQRSQLYNYLHFIVMHPPIYDRTSNLKLKSEIEIGKLKTGRFFKIESQQSPQYDTLPDRPPALIITQNCFKFINPTQTSRQYRTLIATQKRQSVHIEPNQLFAPENKCLSQGYLRRLESRERRKTNLAVKNMDEFAQLKQMRQQNKSLQGRPETRENLQTKEGPRKPAKLKSMTKIFEIIPDFIKSSLEIYRKPEPRTIQNHNILNIEIPSIEPIEKQPLIEELTCETKDLRTEKMRLYRKAKADKIEAKADKIEAKADKTETSQPEEKQVMIAERQKSKKKKERKMAIQEEICGWERDFQ